MPMSFDRRHALRLGAAAALAANLPGCVIKDVVMLGGYQEAEVDFTADNPGRTLFHCHQRLHMDFGFMALFDYV
jgi:FtsP/CotA-like multicopper oxidase with cupredoxin domain